MIVPEPVWSFRIFVAGCSPNSAEALRNLTSLCETYLAGRHEIEIVDVLVDPVRALGAGIVVTPTLIKSRPDPVARIIGNLADADLVLASLGIPERVT